MIAGSQTRWGSGRTPGAARHGSARRWRSYQIRRAAGSGVPDNEGVSDRKGGMDKTTRRRGVAKLAGPAAEREHPKREYWGFRAVGVAVSKLTVPIVARR